MKTATVQTATTVVARAAARARWRGAAARVVEAKVAAAMEVSTTPRAGGGRPR